MFCFLTVASIFHEGVHAAHFAAAQNRPTPPYRRTMSVAFCLKRAKALFCHKRSSAALEGRRKIK